MLGSTGAAEEGRGAAGGGGTEPCVADTFTARPDAVTCWSTTRHRPPRTRQRLHRAVTEREAAVMRLAAGLSGAEIGRTPFLSEAPSRPCASRLLTGLGLRGGSGWRCWPTPPGWWSPGAR